MKTCWVVTEGKIGMENQALGLAEACGFTNIVIKRIVPRFPWSFMAPYIRLLKQFCISSKGDILCAPWPDVLISAGRRSVLPSLWVKEMNPETKLICIQNPKISFSHFDVVLPSVHDHCSGSNVFSVFGALHRVSPARLEEARRTFHFFEKYPSPRMSVLIGGKSRAYTLDLSSIKEIMKKLQAERQRTGGSLLISSSRRTPSDITRYLETLRDTFTYVWDGQENNPYMGMLAWGDIICVTCDSVCMMSEAIATDRPVYLLPLPGGSFRLNSLHQELIHRERVQWFDPPINLGRMIPINSNDEAACFVQSFL